MTMTLQQLTYLRKIMRAGMNISAAAAALGTSQPHADDEDGSKPFYRVKPEYTIWELANVAAIDGALKLSLLNSSHPLA